MLALSSREDLELRMYRVGLPSNRKFPERTTQDDGRRVRDRCREGPSVGSAGRGSKVEKRIKGRDS